jgi:hypothetical protein
MGSHSQAHADAVQTSKRTRRNRAFIDEAARRRFARRYLRRRRLAPDIARARPAGRPAVDCACTRTVFRRVEGMVADGAGSGTMTRMGPSSEDPSDDPSDDRGEGGRRPAEDRDPDREMDALMASPPSPARGESSPTLRTETTDEAGDVDAARRQRRDPESEMAALMGSAEATPDPELRRAGAPSHARRRAVGLDDEMFEAEPRTIVRIRRPVDENAPSREREPVRQRAVAPKLPAALKRRPAERRPPSLVWAVVAGVAIAGVIVLVQRQLRDDAPAQVATKATPKPVAEAPRVRDATNASTQPSDAAPEPAPEPTEPVYAKPTKAEDPPPAVDAETEPRLEPTPPPAPVEPAPKAVKPQPKPKPAGDPRTPPAGTPPEIAAAFAKVPVSPADLPPVGGIGRSGIHVDRIEMGSTYDKGLCGGTPDKFSLAKLERVNVCLRVVHPREEETVSIVWQKKNLGTARRGKIAIKPMHAYRTRAYLVLRKEYVGDWTVRIMSSEGIELASHRFTIVP